MVRGLMSSRANGADSCPGVDVIPSERSEPRDLYLRLYAVNRQVRPMSKLLILS